MAKNTFNRELKFKAQLALKPCPKYKRQKGSSYQGPRLQKQIYKKPTGDLPGTYQEPTRNPPGTCQEPTRN